MSNSYQQFLSKRGKENLGLIIMTYTSADPSGPAIGAFTRTVVIRAAVTVTNIRFLLHQRSRFWLCSIFQMRMALLKCWQSARLRREKK